MDRPSRMTIVGAAIGGIALVGAGAAIATSGEAPETAGPVSSTTEEPTPLETSQSPSAEPSADPDPTATTGGTGQSAPRDGVTPEEAVEIAEQALAEHGSVPPLREVEKEQEHGRTVWEVEFGSDHEVYVDARTGEVVKIELDDDHDDWDDDQDDDYDD